MPIPMSINVRAGQFSANFDPELLDAFRSRCKDKGEKYTKVLEQLAKLYLESDGSVLGVPTKKPFSSNPPLPSTTPSDSLLERRIERLEADDIETGNAFTSVFSRLEACEEKLGLGKYEE